MVNVRFCYIYLIVVCTLACGGTETSDLTVVNTLQSSETIRVDLGGDVRLLNIGDIMLYRSVTQGQHVLLIESTTCVGTTLDTLSVNGNTTVRYLATRNLTTGECQVSSTVTPTTKALPLSVHDESASE
jgi:hypothetical protein